MKRRVFELSVDKSRSVAERDQVAVFFDDPHAAIEIGMLLIGLASDAIKSGEPMQGVTLLGVVSEADE